jgi:methionyl-tRNA synthetase
VPRQLFVHGYLNLDGRGISKSLGNVIRVEDLTGVYGVDALRFWAARAVTLGQDADVTAEGFHERYERELGNDLGNLLSRVTAMLARYRDGSLDLVPVEDSPVAAILEPLGDDVATRLDGFDLTGALERVWEVVRALNRHVEASAPWRLAKDEARAEELDRVLYDLVDGLRAVAVALAAYVPETSSRILEALGQPGDLSWDRVAYGRTEAVEGIEPAAPLFPRVDEPAPAA